MVGAIVLALLITVVSTVAICSVARALTDWYVDGE